jgi:hypothetical protein
MVLSDSTEGDRYDLVKSRAQVLVHCESDLTALDLLWIVWMGRARLYGLPCWWFRLVPVADTQPAWVLERRLAFETSSAASL